MENLKLEIGSGQNRAGADTFLQDLLFINSIFGRPLDSLTSKTVENVPASIKMHFHRFSNVVKSMLEREISLNNDVTFFNEFLNEYNLNAPFDPKKYFESGDIIEVYDETMTQIYRNKTFFEFCSYDMDVMLTVPFYELFRRDKSVDEAMIKRVTELMTTATGIERANIAPHEMQGHFANNSTIFKVEHKWISPLYSKVTGKKMGFLSTQRAQKIGRSNVIGIGFVN